MGDIDNWNAQYCAFNTDDMKDATYAAELMRKDGCTLVTGLGKEPLGLDRVEACQHRLCMA